MEFCLPDLGEGIVEAEFVQWFVAPGDKVKPGQDIAEVMTDKAAVELPSPFAGTIEQLIALPGQQVAVGSALARYKSSDVAAVANVAENHIPVPETTAAKHTHANAQSPVSTEAVSSGKARSTATTVAAPSVRRMARQMGIDLSTVQGSGPNNRVLIDDLAAAVNRVPGTPAIVGNGSKSKNSTNQATPGTRVPLRGLRRTIAQRMTQAKQTIPHFSYIDEVELTDLVRLRESLKEPLEAKGIKLTYLAFFIRAAIGALKDVPEVNASLDADANEIVLHDRYHIGIATDTPGGLLVPVLHDADKMDLQQIALETGQLTGLARSGTATTGQLQGSTFTITSTGGIGGLISTPIVNAPNVGILGIGKIVTRPRFDEDGDIYAANIAYLSFSFDHRVVDGAVGARFANALIARLKNPAALLISD